ncbi:hypothetical protein PLICRDRAFT_162712 [Plicaturopsis crispa FD-325 SS-3]|nr:hypothetical protein PLICRDRAFT_162712 [Plicaturopsis crispa FD-325 SS-3]
MMGPSPTPVFKFNRETLSIKVGNISPTASRAEVVALFNTLVGDVRSCEEHFGNSLQAGSYLELSFYTHDAAKKALCMTGYNVGGCSLLVSAIPSPKVDRCAANQPKRAETRRNLYVLGLPFEFTKTEFTEIFSRCGTVSHCVILATADNAQRRRGFVVMSSHEEAKLAMKVFSRSEIKGHTIDVSWAVVQRSQGFLDGGDRTMALEAQPAGSPTLNGLENCGTNLPSANPSDISAGAAQHDFSFSDTVPTASATLLVTNLPTLLFSQTLDLHPLFCPFGAIKRLEILDPSPQDAASGKTSALVEFATATSAHDAKESLHRQVYLNAAVHVDYVHTASATAPALHGYGISSPRNAMPALNPFAPPFVYDVMPSALCFPSQQKFGNNITNMGACLPSGLLGETHYSSSFAPPPPFSRTNYNLPWSGMSSRSSSTSSGYALSQLL